jgi:hypothetical protein
MTFKDKTLFMDPHLTIWHCVCNVCNRLIAMHWRKIAIIADITVLMSERIVLQASQLQYYLETFIFNLNIAQ